MKTNQSIANSARLLVLALAASFMIVLPTVHAEPANATGSLTCGGVTFTGAGTSGDPAQIATSSELTAAGSSPYCPVGTHFILTADIDRTGVSSSVLLFRGVLDGDDHKIFNISVSGIGSVGLFARASTAEFKNLTISNSVVSGTGAAVGVIVGQNDVTPVTFSNVALIDSRASGSSDVGGLLGFTQGIVSITGVKANRVTVVASTQYAGALLGKSFAFSQSSIVQASVENSTISAGTNLAGGLAGYLMGPATITNTSINSSMVSAGGDYVGGLIGQAVATTTITNISLSGISISAGANYAGGLIGNSNGVATLNSISVTGASISSGNSYAGGLIGFTNNVATIASSSVTVVRVSAGVSWAGGLIGQAVGAATVTDVSMSKASISAVTSWVGGLIGQANGAATVSSISVSAVSISAGASHAGGLIGQANGAATVSSTSVSEVFIAAGASNAGGLIGYAANTVTITSTSVTGSSISARTATRAGGLIGWAATTIISDTSVTGVSASAGDSFVGGLIGDADSTTTIKDTSVTGVSVSALSTRAGGLIGNADANVSVLRTGVSHTQVSASGSVGGLVGQTAMGKTITVTESYFVGTLISSNTQIGSFIGAPGAGADLQFASSYYVLSGASGPVGGTSTFGAFAMTEPEAQLAATFVGWDFTTIWGFRTAAPYNKYPMLRSSPLFSFVAPVTSVPAATSSPSPAQADPAPAPEFSAPVYSGPVFTGVSVAQVEAGKPLTLSGSRFTGITSVSIDGVKVTIVTMSASTLEILVPSSLTPGVKSIVLVSANGTVTFLDVFEVVTAKAEVEDGKKLTVGTYLGWTAIFTKGYEGQRLSVRVGSRWFVVDPIENTKDGFSRLKVKTGSGVKVKVNVFIDRVLTKTETVVTR